MSFERLPRRKPHTVCLLGRQPRLQTCMLARAQAWCTGVAGMRPDWGGVGVGLRTARVGAYPGWSEAGV
eukprot:364251-Chlamydomonas_euryale.AAC.8